MAEKRRLDFVFLCDKRFEELDGKDSVVRHCASCGTDVFDLDRFTDEELHAFLEASDAAGMELCARLTVRAEARPCAEHMRPGTYTGRTEASYRRSTTRGAAMTLEALIERHERASAEVARLVGQVRKRGDVG